MARTGALAVLGITTLVLAHVGGAQAVGLYTLLKILPSLAGVLVSSGLPAAVTYFLSSSSSDEARLRPTIIAVMLGAGVAGSLLWAALAVPLRAAFFPQLTIGLMVWVGLSVLTHLIVATSKSCCQGSGDIQGANWVILLDDSTFLPAYLVLLAAGVHGNAAIVAALITSDVMTFTPAAIRLLRRGFLTRQRRGRPSVALARQVAGYGMRGQVGGFLSLINYRLDHIMLGAIAGPAVLGVYAIASKFAELLRLVPLALNYVLYPRFASKGAEQATREARRLLRRAGVLTALATIPLAVGAEVIPFFYGHKFSPAVWEVRILLLGLVGEGVAQVASAYLFGRGRPGLNSMAMGAGVIVTIVGDLILIRPFGATGAAWASTAAYLATTVFLLRCFARVSAEPVRAGPAVSHH